MNTKPSQPQTPSSDEDAQMYASVQLNREHSSGSGEQSNLTAYQSATDEEETLRKSLVSTSKQSEVVTQSVKNISPSPKPASRKRNHARTIFYAVLAVAIFVESAIAIMLIFFSLPSNNASAAPMPSITLPSSAMPGGVNKPIATMQAEMVASASRPRLVTAVQTEAVENTGAPQFAAVVQAKTYARAGGAEPTATGQAETVGSTGGGQSTATVQAETAGSLAVYEPPVIGQGGRCISGSVIDIYHNLVGAGLNITVTPKDGGSTKSLKSDASGHFQVNGLAAGTYTVTVQVLEGWKSITAPSFDVVLNGTSAQCAEVRAKFELPSCLVVSKLNHDKTGRTVGIPGWNITISKDNKILKASTDSDGRAYFPNLETGKWTIAEELRDGWWPVPVTQSIQRNMWISSIFDPGGYEISVLQTDKQNWWSMPEINPYSGTTRINVLSAPYPQDPSFCQPVPIVNKQIKGSIVIKKEDDKGNPLQGWTINLTSKDGTQPSQSKVTESDGTVCFSDLELGEWNVTEVLQPNWAMVSAPENPIKLTTRQDCSILKTQNIVYIFKNKPVGCVDGYKINDLEQVLSGWKIDAKNLSTEEKYSGITDANGYFRIDGLEYGTWQVSEILQSGWEPVTPSEFPVTISGSECKHVRFKNRTKYACLDVWKKDAYDGKGLPEWSISLQPFYSDSILSQKKTSGDGWVRFEKLQPGDYVVSETGQSGWHSIGDSSYRLNLEASGTCSVVTFCNLQNNMGLPTNQVCIPGVKSRDISSNTPTLSTYLPTPSPVGVSINPPAQRNYCAQWYTIRPGDTLYWIAPMFGISLNELEIANPSVNPRFIYPNMILCIPWPGNG